VVGALLLNFTVLAPHLAWNVHAAEDVAATLLFLAVGGVIGVVAGETERARRAALTAKERSNEFVSVVSHELRQPLTGIKGSVQFARRQLKKVTRDEAQQASIGESAQSNSGRAQRLESIDALLEHAERQMSLTDRLVEDLLDSTRIETSKLNIRLEQCDPVEVVRLAVEEQRQAWPEREILLDTSAGRGLHTLADPTRIGQVVTNYLTNALKYAPADRPIVVRVRRRHGEAHVSVRDEGPGLPPDEQRRIWERFHRAKGIEVKQGGGVGLGLGLHISKTIIDRHGGRVGVMSAPGRGSTFWFALPLASERKLAMTRTGQGDGRGKGAGAL
ncbi:MAG: sensor histidine kinase, partial [Ktedonobacterales bacterium]